MRRGLNVGSSVVLVAGSLLLAPPAAAQTAAELREMIELQRQQIEQQAQQLEIMEERLQELETTTEATRETAEQAQRTAAQGRDQPTIGSANTGIKLAISGQVNRMVTAAYDGDDTKLFNVDNVNSSSRLRVVGSARTEAFTIGTNFEFEMRSNASTEVSQINEDTGIQGFRERFIEAFFAHDDLGKITIGQGSTAADGTSEMDLSGTTVIAYSSISDTAGGLLFFDDDANALSGTSIGNVFNNFDGLSRQDRIRYDTPTFAGFTAAVDAISNQRWSTALRWSGKSDALSAAAAFGYSDPGGDRDWVLSSSASVLHVPTGLSLTLSASGRDNPDRDDALSLYGKLGYQKDFFTFGRTHLGLDLARNDDIAVEGDEATSIGFSAVQNIKNYGIELFGLYRWHELDRRGADFADVHIFTLGTRVRF
jgi:hypothetical protein